MQELDAHPGVRVFCYWRKVQSRGLFSLVGVGLAIDGGVTSYKLLLKKPKFN